MLSLKNSKTFVRMHSLFLFFSVLYLAFCFLTYKDYGVTYDEKVEYDAGRFLNSYILNPTKETYVASLVNNKPNYIEARHLPLFSVYSRVYPAFLNIINPNGYFEHFHLGNLIFGYFMFLFAYILFFLFYKNPKKAMVAPLFLVLTPMLLGHIPANPKDIPFATFYLLGILATYYFQTHKINKNAEIILLGVIFGLVLSQRTVGLTLFIAYIFSKLIMEREFNLGLVMNIFLQTALVFCVSLLIWIICLPFLGANLPANFIELLRNAAGYPEWNHEIIYWGKYLTKEQRPWNYLFVYLIIQLPLFILFSLIAGIVFLLTKKMKYVLTHPAVSLSLLVGLNVSLYLILHPVVYNGIRHFLYLVVCLALIAAFFFLDVLEVLKLRFKYIVVLALSLYALITAVKMANLHPYEYIYYNELVGGLRGTTGKFDVEYWGASYKEGAEYVRDLVEQLDAGGIKVYACDNQFAVVYYSHFKYELVGSSKEADIVICDLHKDGLRPQYNDTHPIIRTIQREGVSIFNIRASKKFIEKYSQKWIQNN